MNATDNNLRTLAGLISLDGWISDFDDNNLATVHVDLVFSESRFGSSPEDKVRFKIKVKRAELWLIVPNGEPLKIRKDTISRNIDSTTKTLKTTETEKRSLAGEISTTAGFENVPKASVKASAVAQASGERTVQSDETEIKGKFFIQHKSDINAAGWEIGSNNKGTMSGSPWDANSDYRLKVKRTAERNNDGCKPTIRLEVKCRREDIEILDLVAKDLSLDEKLGLRSHKARHIVVAEQIIKQQIEKEGFIHTPDMSEPDSVVIIADMLIMEQE